MRRLDLAYPKKAMACPECGLDFPVKSTYKLISQHFAGHGVQVWWNCDGCLEGSMRFADPNVRVVVGHRRRCSAAAAADLWLCEFCGQLCAGECGYGLHMQQAHRVEFEARLQSPKRAYWTDYERSVLALAELAYARDSECVKSAMVRRLFESHPFQRTEGALAAQRRTSSYKRILKDLAVTRPEGELPLGKATDLGCGSTDTAPRVSAVTAVSLSDYESDSNDSIASDVSESMALSLGLSRVDLGLGVSLFARGPPLCTKTRFWVFLLRRHLDELSSGGLGNGSLNAFLQCLRARVKTIPPLWKSRPGSGRPRPRRWIDNMHSTNSGKYRRRLRFHLYQSLWKTNRRACLSAILDGSPVEAELPELWRVEAYYEAQFERTSYCGGPIRNWAPVPCTREVVLAPIHFDEVHLVVRRMKSQTSAGMLQGIPAWFLKRHVARTVLASLFNIWFRTERVPEALKDSYTTLIPKKLDGLEQVRNWRPVTVGPLLLRVYCAVLARRLADSVQLHRGQKAFLPADGCSENVVLMDSLFRAARTRGKALFVVFLDLSQAFSTVSHHSVELALRRHRVPGKVVRVIRDLYDGAFTRVSSRSGYTKRLYFRSGVKQGCPLSPVLFNLVMDELYSGLPSEWGFRLGGEMVSALGFADDIALVSGSQQGLRQLLRYTCSFLRDRGLILNPAKCESISLVRCHRRKVLREGRVALVVDGHNIPCVPRSGTVRYLGVRFSSVGLPKASLEVLETALRRLGKCPLKGIQRVQALKSRVLPKVLYQWERSVTTMGILRRGDRLVRQAVKRWLHLPRGTASGFLHLARGGLGLPRLVDVVPRRQLSVIRRMKDSRDPLIRASIVGWAPFERKWCRLLGVSDAEEGSSKLTKAAQTDRLREAFLGTVQSLGHRAFRRKGNMPVLDHAWRRKIPKVSEYLKMVTNQLPSLEALGRDPINGPKSLKCRLCGAYRETNLHVLQTCPGSHKAVCHRHTKIVEWLCRKLQAQKLEVHRERSFKSRHGKRRPDLVVKAGNRAYVCDVAVVYEAGNGMESRAVAKRDKYKCLAAAVRKELGVDVVETVGLVFGARGAIPETTRKALYSLGLPMGKLVPLQFQIVADSLWVFQAFLRRCQGWPVH